MQVNQANVSTPNNVNNAQTSRQLSEQNSARAINPELESNKQSTPPRVDRVEADEQAIALVQARQEQNQASASQNNQSRLFQETTYDQPPQRNQTAVAAYQKIDNAEQRDNIAQVFGVDLFA